MKAMLATLAAAAEPRDPIFAAIEKHRAEYQRWKDSPEAIDEKEYSYFQQFVATKPTTIAGLAAFAEYIGTTTYLQDFSEAHLQTAFATLADGLGELAAEGELRNEEAQR